MMLGPMRTRFVILSAISAIWSLSTLPCMGFQPRTAFTTSNKSLLHHNIPSQTTTTATKTTTKTTTATTSLSNNVRLNYAKADAVEGQLASGVAEAVSSLSSMEYRKSADGQVEPTEVGVLLLNLGGPETGEDVEEFLYNLFADPDIIRLPAPLAPLQKYIAGFISRSRSPKSREAYESIGGGSPILRYSNEQAALLTAALQKNHGLKAKCYVGMRYWDPFTEKALEDMRRDGVNALVIVPLYPQFSISTSGSSLRVLQEEFAKRAERYGADVWKHTVVASWYDRPGYVNAMVRLIEKELDSFTEEELEVGGGERHVLFSAHGVPRSYIEAGDPYQTQIQDCVHLITQTLHQKPQYQSVKLHLAYQSRVGPVEWLRPYTDDVLPQLGANGVKNLVVVPISFVSEHIETLEEIDIEYRELAEESGIVHWRRVPALNTNEDFIEDMADLVVEALSEPVQTVTEACIANNCEMELQPLDERIGIAPSSTSSMTSAAAVKGGKVWSEEEKEEMMISMMAATTGRVTNRNEKVMKDAEKINGRVALLGVAGTIVLELLSGKSLLHMFGM